MSLSQTSSLAAHVFHSHSHSHSTHPVHGAEFTPSDPTIKQEPFEITIKAEFSSPIKPIHSHSSSCSIDHITTQIILPKVEAALEQLTQHTMSLPDSASVGAATDASVDSVSAQALVHKPARTPFVHRSPTFELSSYLGDYSPSRLDGFTIAQECDLRCDTVHAINHLATETKVGHDVAASASTFAHVFFTRFSFAQFDRLLVAAAALLSSCKIERLKSRVGINRITHTILRMRAAWDASSEDERRIAESNILALDHPDFDTVYKTIQEQIYHIEALMLEAIDFTFVVEKPLAFVKQFLDALKEHYNLPENPKADYRASIVAFIQNSYLTDLCLCFPASVIAVAAIHTAIDLWKVPNIPSDWHYVRLFLCLVAFLPLLLSRCRIDSVE
jgi:hypothetical protein